MINASTKETVTSEDIQMMPVEDIGAVVNLQAGVMDGHFRGGRSNEADVHLRCYGE